jgi:hypothetical protein
VPLLEDELGGVFGRGALAESAVRSLGIVGVPPGVDGAARLGQRGEVLQVQAFVAPLAVDALDKTVLDRASGDRASMPWRRRVSPVFPLRSASCRIATISSSVKRVFRISPPRRSAVKTVNLELDR